MRKTSKSSASRAIKADFLAAAKAGDVDAIREMLQSGADPNLLGARRAGALEIAAALGHIDVVKALLAAGADVNAQDRENHDALAYAVKGGFLEIVKLLLAAGASVNTGLLQYHAVVLASMFGHIEILRELIEAGARVNGRNGVEAFQWAIQKKNEDVGLLLIEKGVDLSRRECGEQLVKAARLGLSRLVRAMLEGGVDSEIRDHFGQSAEEVAGNQQALRNVREGKVAETQERQLIKSAAAGNTRKVTALVKAGVCLGTRDANDTTALLRAIDKNRPKVVKVLLEAGADPNQSRPLLKHETMVYGTKVKAEAPLALATLCGHAEIVESLLRYKADVTDRSCEAAACHALLMRSPRGIKAVRLLLDAGLNPRCQWRGFSILHHAKGTRLYQQIAELQKCTPKDRSPAS